MKNLDNKRGLYCANLNDCRACPACASLPVMNTPKRPMQPPMEEPLDHRQFVAALSPEQRRALTAKSDSAGLLHLAGHLTLIAVLATAVIAKVPFWWALMLPLGVALIFLFTLNHEAIHRTAFAADWLNETVSRVCALLLILPATWFRFFHFEHHRHTQDPDRDPELAGTPPQTRLAWLWHVSGIPLWISAIRGLFTNAAGLNRDPFVPPSARGRVQREALTMVAVYLGLLAVSLWLQTAVLLWVWIIPALLGQPFLRLYLLAEHGRCAFVANMFENSRSTFTGPLVRFLAWNMPYHAEHHAFPTVPFYRLPQLHRLTAPHLRVTSPGYRDFTARSLAALGDNSPKT